MTLEAAPTQTANAPNVGARVKKQAGVSNDEGSKLSLAKGGGAGKESALASGKHSGVIIKNHRGRRTSSQLSSNLTPGIPMTNNEAVIEATYFSSQVKALDAAQFDPPSRLGLSSVAA